MTHLTLISFCLLACFLSGSVFANSDLKELERTFNRGDIKTVITELEKRPQKSVDDFMLLISAYEAQDLDDAEEAANRAISAHPTHHKPYLAHASIMGAQATSSVFSALSYAKKALNSIKKAVELEPEKVATLSALMSFYMQAPSIAGGDMDEAQRLIEKISTIDPVAGQFAKVRFLMRSDNIQEAEKLLLELAKNEESKFEAHYQLGELYGSQKDYNRAVEFLTVASKVLLTKPADITNTEALAKYKNLKRQQAYANYSIGLAAINSKSHNLQGIEALKRFITEMENPDYSIAKLPSVNWARLRLAALQLNAGNVEGAKATFSLVEVEDSKKFKKTYKNLKGNLG